MSAFVFTLPAVVDRVIDGDSLVVHLKFLPGKELHGEHVRVEGINAPELHHEGGRRARVAAQALCPPGTPVTLVMAREDKYGRILAAVRLPDGSDFGQRMIEGGFAEPWRS